MRSLPRGSRYRNLYLVLAASAFLGIATGIYETTFNNFLDDIYQIEAATRGWLELPREIPGLLVAVFTGLLFFMSDSRMGALAMGVMGIGLFGLSVIPSTFGLAVLWLLLMSIGQHIYQPLEQAIGMAVARKDRAGTRLGQIMSVRIAATVAGAGLVWIFFDYLDLFYNHTFAIAAVASIGAAVVLFLMRDRGEGAVRAGAAGGARLRFLYRRKFGLFYLLNFFFGARKQVGMTFGPWVVIRIFGQSASVIARLWMISSVIGIFFRPYLGRLIDRLGERPILIADALGLFLVCIGYGWSEMLGLEGWGLWVIYFCFICDRLLFSAGMARTTYATRLADDEDELTPTLSLGISINHAVSMSIPILGGLIWTGFGYRWVFVMFGIISLFNAWAAARISPRGSAVIPEGTAEEESVEA